MKVIPVSYGWANVKEKSYGNHFHSSFIWVTKPPNN